MKRAAFPATEYSTLSSLLTEDGSIVQSVFLQHVGETFRSFLWSNPVHEKDMQDKGSRGWKVWAPEKFESVMRKNPIHFLSKADTYYHYDEINKVFYLDDSIKAFLGQELAAHVRDILTWRKVNYFRKRFREEDQ